MFTAAKKLRVLLDTPLDGPANMARDEALMEAVGNGQAPSTLRFYAWDPPTISLGYFQEFAEFRELAPPAGALAVVRRTTGGGAILHDLELTYSLTVPIDHPWLARGANRLYEMMHAAVVRAIGHGARLAGCGDAEGAGSCDQSAQRGPFFCFARRHALDVVVPDPRDPSGWSKIAGSAQRRTRLAVLQHGSIILQSRFEQQPCATWSACGGPADYREAAARVLDALSASLDALSASTDIDAAQSEWKAAEINDAKDLASKYAGADWTGRR